MLHQLDELLKQMDGTTDIDLQLNCLLKSGEWKLAVLEPGKAVSPQYRINILNVFTRATQIQPTSYRAWHEWGLANYRALEESKKFDRQRNSLSSSANGQHPASGGFSSKHQSSFIIGAAKVCYFVISYCILSKLTNMNYPFLYFVSRACCVLSP